jgi:hypothetical protein
MNSKIFFVFVWVGCLGAPCLAQVAHDLELHDSDAPLATPSPPPLVTDDGTRAKVSEVEAPHAEGGPVALEEPREEPGRGLRVGLSLLGGAVAGTALAVAGGLVGAASAPNPKLQPLGNAWGGASVGFAVGAPVGVLVAAWLLKGHGAWWAVVLADVLGFGLGALSVALGGTAGTPLLFALPLGGSVLADEVSQ